MNSYDRKLRDIEDAARASEEIYRNNPGLWQKVQSEITQLRIDYQDVNEKDRLESEALERKRLGLPRLFRG